MHISTQPVDQTCIWLEKWYPESSLLPRGVPGSVWVCLPQARWRAPDPQEHLLLPCPTLLSAAGLPQPADRGPPGAEAQRGAVAWVGSMPTMMVVVMMEDEEKEEEEEKEKERSQPPVCYEQWPPWPLAGACCSSCWSGALRSTGNESHPPTHVQLQLC